MILFPNAKINLGLRIVGRRPDGYHELETIMLPIGWCDILEIVPSSDGENHFNLIGEKHLDCRPEDNLVVRALAAVEKHIGHTLPPTDIYLSKLIPSGAGLGGGSSDASFAIRAVNELYGLGLSLGDMADVALTVGADCPFFIYNRPMLAHGIGEVLTPIEIPSIEGMEIVVAKPQSDSVSTREAYAGAKLCGNDIEHLDDIVTLDPHLWPKRKDMTNDFEQSIFPLRPEIARVKDVMNSSGAVYSSMSGSGASVFGLFDDAKMAEKVCRDLSYCEVFRGSLPYVMS